MALKLLISIAFGQAYAFLVIVIAADLWPVITLLLFFEAFLSSSLLLRSLEWGISMCLGELSNVARLASSSSCADRDTLKTAGTICSFFILKAQYQEFFQQGEIGWSVRPQVIAWCYRYSAQILVPSCLSVGITLLLSLCLFPKLMFVEFNKLLSERLLPKTRAIYQRLYELYMTENNGTGKGQEVCWASLFQDQHSLFELADRLPFLLQIANQEGAWTLTNLGTYHEQVLRPLMQLAYMTTYMTRLISRFNVSTVRRMRAPIPSSC